MKHILVITWWILCGISCLVITASRLPHVRLAKSDAALLTVLGPIALGMSFFALAQSEGGECFINCPEEGQ